MGDVCVVSAKGKKTDDLLQELGKTAHIDEYLRGNENSFRNESFANAMNRFFAGQRKSKAAIARSSGISDIYLYQIFAGSRLPSRDRLACICIGMQMTDEDTQYLMRLCGHAPLYARDRRDAVILHGLLHRSSLYEINNALIDHQMDPLL